MLKSLNIKNFILIEDVTLDFTCGFNVLCGETGAGKSIIIKALDCVLGAKMAKEVILDSTKPCTIEAVFENGGVETTVSRELSSQSKFRLNGILSSIDEIKDIRESLVDIHSQHQTYSYISPKHHINLLDNYIIKKTPEFSDLLSVYKSNYLELKAIEKKLLDLKENFQNNEKEIDFLTFQLKELDEAGIKENEEDELQSELDILSNVQELKEGSYSAYYALYGDNQSIVEALGKIKYTISSLSELDKNLKESESTLFDAFENLKETANFLKDYSYNLELNPQRLDELNERISLIQKLKRKYGQDLDTKRDEIEKRLNELTNSENSIEEVQKKYKELQQTINMLAQKIEEYRIKNAEILSKLILENLKNLELKQAQFEISITPTKINELGQNNVEFLIATNKNQSLAPMSKIASGGEISRVMLALKTVFANTDNVQTVVFDEIDTGISGITSNAVAASMLELAKTTQIICITHQPIICAKADNFIWISKEHKDKTNIKAEVLNNDSRLNALAQLAGGEISEKSLEFAKTLL